jgi:hypothetical protein
MRLRLAGLEEPGRSVGAERSLDRIFLLRDGIRIGESALVMDRPTRVKMSATRTLIASICLLRISAANADAPVTAIRQPMVPVSQTGFDENL